MHIEQTQWTMQNGWQPHAPGKACREADLILLFGTRELLDAGQPINEIAAAFPRALITGCSTAGEIFGTQVTDGHLVCTAIHFDATRGRQESIEVHSPEDSFVQGLTLAGRFEQKDLCHVLVFSDGLHINGTNLVKGMQTVFPDSISITGGLAADGEKFADTCVLVDGIPRRKVVVAIGLYSQTLQVGFGTFGGWDPFGPERLITRSSGNILYELGGESALSLYKKYLGAYAEKLPASALLFPLAIRSDSDDHEIVRTILGVSENDQSLTFAGDMPEGHYARFMKCNMDRLIDGAVRAAQSTAQSLNQMQTELALLISCVGRKMVLKQRVEEEIEGVREVLGSGPVLAGFYSYGEISPLRKLARCELLNQTMTITAFSEQPPRE